MGPRRWGGQVAGGVDGRGAVCAADDADGRGLRAGKAQQGGANVGDENAQLGSGAQQQALGVGNQGTEVGHGAHAHEDKAGVHAQLHAQVQHVQQAHGDRGAQQAGKLVKDGLRGAARGDLIDDFLGDCGAAKQLPLHMPVGEEHLVVHPGAGQVGQQHAKGDRQQQQGLKLLDDGQVQQHAGHHQHHQAQGVLLHNVKAGLLQKVNNSVHRGIHSLFISFTGRSTT